MTSTVTGVIFFTKANLYCYTNFLSMKHANVLESRSVGASIIVGLLHLILIDIKKNGGGPKGDVFFEGGLFQDNDATRA